MNFKKAATIAAAAGALAAVSVPAMAFENEVHGTYNLKFFGSNYENGFSSAIVPTAYPDNNKANNFIEQRARLQYIAKASDDLKLVTHFELDTKFGGDKSGKYGVSSDAGVLDADGIMLETKHVYLDFNLGSVNLKTGIQPIKDNLKGILIDADVTGITVTGKPKTGLTLVAGFYRLGTDTSMVTTGGANPASATSTGVNGTQTTNLNTNTSEIGHNNIDMALLIGKYAVNKDLNIGAGYYLFSNYQNTLATGPVTYHTFAVDADAKVGPATVSGFVAAQVGSVGVTTTSAHRSIASYAANLGAKLPVGPGTAHATFLYTSGDGDQSGTNTRDTEWKNCGVTTFTEGNMMRLVRTGAGGTTNDRTIVGPAGAGKMGVTFLAAGYDAVLSPKLFANANVGVAFAATSEKAPAAPSGVRNNNNLLGTELNAEVGYKVYDNLTAKVQAAYVILGDYYKDAASNSIASSPKSPDNPYTGRIMLSYAF